MYTTAEPRTGQSSQHSELVLNLPHGWQGFKYFTHHHSIPDSTLEDSQNQELSWNLNPSTSLGGEGIPSGVLTAVSHVLYLQLSLHLLDFFFLIFFVVVFGSTFVLNISYNHLFNFSESLKIQKDNIYQIFTISCDFHRHSNF